MRVAAVVTAGALLLPACGSGAGASGRTRLELQRTQLEASLDQLEARLLDGQARERSWRDLQRRHGRVSAVSCDVSAAHLRDMARVEEEARWQAAAARAPRLAAVAAVRPGRAPGATPPPGPVVSGAAPAAAPAGLEVPGSGGD